MTAYSEFYDPRLVAIYDTINPIDEYRDFYLALAAELSAASIIDIGCGSGLLTCELAQRGHRMIGVEPSGAMLELARKRCDGVTWVESGAGDLGELNADLAIMTGHVAQFFLDDESWQAALAAVSRALKPGGHLAFESRNPIVLPFAIWPTRASHRKLDDPIAGPVEWWTEIREVEDEFVRYDIHYLFTNSGEEVVSENELRFRSQSALTQTLSDAVFTVESVFGDWDRQPVGPASPELIFVATRR